MTKNIRIPEVIIGAKKNSINLKVEKIIDFFTPLKSEKAAQIIWKVKNSQDSVKYLDGSSIRNLIYLSQENDALNDYDFSFYAELVDQSELKEFQKLVLIDLALVYDNAKELAGRNYMKDSIPSKIAYEYAEEVMSSIQKMMKILGKHMPDESFCEKFLPKVCGLNGTLITFAEVGL